MGEGFGDLFGIAGTAHGAIGTAAAIAASELAEGADKLTGVDTGFHGLGAASYSNGTLAAEYTAQSDNGIGVVAAGPIDHEAEGIRLHFAGHPGLPENLRLFSTGFALNTLWVSGMKRLRAAVELGRNSLLSTPFGMGGGEISLLKKMPFSAWSLTDRLFAVYLAGVAAVLLYDALLYAGLRLEIRKGAAATPSLWPQAMANPEIIVELGRRFKEYRLTYRLTQKEAAEKAGVSLITLRQFENGKAYNINMGNFLALLRVVDCLEQMDDLMPEIPVSAYTMERIMNKKPKRIRHGK